MLVPVPYCRYNKKVAAYQASPSLELDCFVKKGSAALSRLLLAEVLVSTPGYCWAQIYLHFSQAGRWSKARLPAVLC